VKHWDDHAKGKVEKPWHEIDALSKKRLRNLLGMEEGIDLGEFGLGSERSLLDYERYAGIDLKGRRLQRDTMAGKEPPCHYRGEEEWEADFGRSHQITIRWNPNEFPDKKRYQFVFFGVEDGCGNLLYRFDAQPDTPEFQGLVNSKRVSFSSSSKPSKLVIWPYLREVGWGKKSVRKI